MTAVIEAPEQSGEIIEVDESFFAGIQGALNEALTYLDSFTQQTLEVAENIIAFETIGEESTTNNTLSDSTQPSASTGSSTSSIFSDPNTGFALLAGLGVIGAAILLKK